MTSNPSSTEHAVHQPSHPGQVSLPSGEQAASLPPPRLGIAALGSVGALALVLYALQRHGADRAVLLVLGLGLGVTLFHARFGFTSAWRQLVSVGQGRGLQAHTLMLGTAVVLFAPILSGGIGLFGGQSSGFVAPITLGLFVGSVLFGIGMQLGGACASGTLYATGSGHVPVLVTFAAFIVGSIAGIRTMHWWLPGGPAGLVLSEPVSLADTPLGYPGGVAISLLALAAIALVAERVRRRRQPPPIEPVASTRGIARILRGSWPLWVGALMLAGLNALVLLTSGSPWGVTGAFRLWGSKLVGALGLGDPASWPAWQGNPALEASVLLDNTSVTNIGIILGALIAAAIAGSCKLKGRIPRELAAAHGVGGIAMGYGASIAFGCNIGAYFSGIASMSLHGWIWGVTALGGTWLGLRLRSVFGLTNPKPSDSVC